MENASKALIIAGAILLSILIIGLGVFIFQMAQGAMSDVNMDKSKIMAFNQSFMQYVGENVSGSSVMALCDELKTHNLSYTGDQTKQISIKLGSAATDTAATDTSKLAEPTNVKAQIRSGYSYQVTVGYDPNTGFISNIGVVKK